MTSFRMLPRRPRGSILKDVIVGYGTRAGKVQGAPTPPKEETP